MSRLRPALVVAAALILGSCVTPSIPVPPPEVQSMVFALDGTPGAETATFAYTSNNTNVAGAIVYVFDRNRGHGVIDTIHDDGTIGPTAPFAASAGDFIDVTFQEGDQAQSICVVLRAGTPQAQCL